jgi:hypothetical protein
MKVIITDSIRKEIIERAKELQNAGLTTGPSNIKSFETLNIFLAEKPDTPLCVIQKEDEDNVLKRTIYLGA